MAQQDASVAIVMTARDEASDTFDSVRRSMGRMGQDVEGARTSANMARSSFMGLGKQLVGMAVGAIGVAQLFTGIKSAMDATAKSSTEAAFIVAGFGPAAEKSLEEAEKSFASLAIQYATTESEIRGVFITLIRDAHRTSISVEQLADTLALARAANISFAASADIMAQSLQGNDEPLKRLLGPLGYHDLTEAVTRAKEEFEGAITVFDRVGAALARMYENLGQGRFQAIADEFDTLVVAFGQAAFQKVMDDTGDRVDDIIEGYRELWRVISGGDPVGITTTGQAARDIQERFNIQPGESAADVLSRTGGNTVIFQIEGNLVIDSEDRQQQLIQRTQEALNVNTRRGG